MVDNAIFVWTACTAVGAGLPGTDRKGRDAAAGSEFEHDDVRGQDDKVALALHRLGIDADS